MADETSDHFDRIDYEKRVEKLGEQDKGWPAVLAARSALRVLPLIATLQPKTEGEPEISRSAFGFWKPEERLKHLTAIFFPPVFVLKMVVEKESPGLKSIDAARAARAASEACSAADRAYVADRAYGAYAADVADTAAAASIAYTSADVAVAAYKAAAAASAVYTAVVDYAIAADVYAADAIAAALKDLELAESHQSLSDLIDLPLWQGRPIPEAFQRHYSDVFVPAVDQLIHQSEDKKSSSALKHMQAIYEHLLAGSKGDVIHKTVYEPSEVISSETKRNPENHLGEERQGLVDGLVKYLKHEDNSGHLTIGLLGNWGSGKTRVLDLLKDQLEKKIHLF